MTNPLCPKTERERDEARAECDRLRQELSAERERADEHQRERTRLLRERDAAEAALGRSALARFREATK